MKAIDVFRGYRLAVILSIGVWGGLGRLSLAASGAEAKTAAEVTSAGPSSPAGIVLALDAPSLAPPAVQFAVFGRDYASVFKAEVRSMQPFNRRQLESAKDEAEKELVRNAEMTVAWHTGFKEVTGDQIHLLTAQEAAGASSVVTSPIGKRWIVTKIVYISGKPVCWCIPVDVKAGEMVKVTLTEGNMFDLRAAFDDAAGQPASPRKVEEPKETVTRKETAKPRKEAGGREETGRRLGEIDVVRVRELHHITDTLGNDIWPGFDTRKIPVAINNDDKEELLVGHPNPPKEYRPFKDFKLNGQPVMIRDGVTQFGPKTGGWAVEIGGKHCAYVSPFGHDRTMESYLSLILHECFHCFQRDYRQRADGARGELPEDDPVYSAVIGLESQILKAALDEPNGEKARELAKMFVVVRQDRRKHMPQNLVLLEGEDEYNEGSASYCQARAYQLMAERGGFAPLDKGKDPEYQGFQNPKSGYEQMISEIILSKGFPISFFHAMYKHGMAQCLLLDRVRPGWKEEMRSKGMTQFALLEKEFPLDEKAKTSLAAEARNRFGYDGLLAEQKKLIDERLRVIREYVDAPGRLYRIYHNDMPGKFNWKPAGPVYHVPESLEKELAEKRKNKGGSLIEGAGFLGMRRSVWAGGISRLEKGGLDFQASDTPIIFGVQYLEWIDPKPAPDNSDMNIESESKEGDWYVGAKISTHGFVLKAEKARVEWSKDIVRIRLASK